MENRKEFKLDIEKIWILFFCLLEWPMPYINKVLDASIIAYLYNLFIIMGVVFLIGDEYKIKIKKISLVIAFYPFILIVSTLINSTSDFYIIFTYIKKILVILVFNHCISKSYAYTLKCLFGIFISYLSFNLLSLYVFPDGLYFQEYVYEWTTQYEPRWALGHKNTISYYVLIAFFILFMIEMIDKRKYYFWCIILSIISMISCLLADTSTGIAISSLLAVGYWICSYKPLFENIKTKHIVYCYVLITVVIITDSISFLEPITNLLFNKGTDFSTRTTVWANALNLIIKKPCLGFGYLPNKSISLLLGHPQFVSTHNTLLQVLFEGGTVLGIWYLSSLFIFASIIDNSNWKNKSVFVVAFVAFLLESSFESINQHNLFFLFFQIMLGLYHFNNNNNNNNTNLLYRKKFRLIYTR